MPHVWALVYRESGKSVSPPIVRDTPEQCFEHIPAGADTTLYSATGFLSTKQYRAEEVAKYKLWLERFLADPDRPKSAGASNEQPYREIEQ